MERIKIAIVGPGNIGIDLMKKIQSRSRYMQLEIMAGIIKESLGLKMAAQQGIRTSYTGIEEVLNDNQIKIVFECTSAKAHLANAPLYQKAGKVAIDLTPAAVGPYVVPVVNMNENLKQTNVNMVTCGGQATVPIINAVSSVATVEYAEIISTISSLSAGPGTRQNIDEFTLTTANAIEVIGGAKKAKAIIILNPADPPIMMRNTIYCKVINPDMEKINKAVEIRVKELQEYVPGYRMTLSPLCTDDKITIMIEVEGSGDYLPKYSGNLDIITSAAIKVGDRFAEKMLERRG